MGELSREGHRQRLRKTYLDGAAESLPDHNLLELLLFYSIPRRDVKELSYNLMNRFGSLENVFKADKQDLLGVNGVGENTAALLMLVDDINRRIDLNRSRQTKRLATSEESMEYAQSLLGNLPHERAIVVTLDNSMNIINTHKVADGTVNFTAIDPKIIVKCVLQDNASSVIMAHNHPSGEPVPSLSDVNFTVDLLNVMRKLNVNLLDHIIVGGERTESMCHMPEYANFFDD